MPEKDIFQAATDILKDVYGKINGGITLLCVVFISICLIGMTISKNQKTVDEFRAWGKRIAWAWVIFFTLGSIVQYLQTVLVDYSFNPDDVSGTSG